MKFADVMVGVDYEVSIPSKAAPTFEVLSGAPSPDDGTLEGALRRFFWIGKTGRRTWTVIDKRGGWVLCRMEYQAFDDRTPLGEMQDAMTDGGEPANTVTREIVVRVRPVRIKRTLAEREFRAEVLAEALRIGRVSTETFSGSYKEYRGHSETVFKEAEEAVIARRLDLPPDAG